VANRSRAAFGCLRSHAVIGAREKINESTLVVSTAPALVIGARENFEATKCSLYQSVIGARENFERFDRGSKKIGGWVPAVPSGGSGPGAGWGPGAQDVRRCASKGVGS